MNKTELKNFAVSARRDLLEKVALRAKIFGIDAKSSLTIEDKFGQLAINGETYSIDMKPAFISLKKQLDVKGYKQLIEEVAYTWFNRIISIRYMEVNNHLPERVNVLSSSTGKVEPDILSHFETMDLDIDNEIIKELIREGDIELAYRKLFISQCNALNKILPFLFEEIHDYTELLLPDFLLDRESVISQLVKNVSEDNFYNYEEEKDNVEVLGWIYQYYMTEKKEKVGGLKNTAVKKEDLPVVTQLFTPKWIVQYMVQNSLGKLYDEKYPNNNLVSNWEYYLKASTETKLLTEFDSLEQIKIIDPACGSGHILLYAFDLLYDMYEEAGYPSSEIPKLILENNLYGLDIDKRAQQIANLALIMKALEKQPRLLKRKQLAKLNILEIKDTDFSLTNEAIEFFAENEDEVRIINHIQEKFANGKQFGSLVRLDNIDYENLIYRMENIKQDHEDLLEQIYILELKEKLLPLLKQAMLLSQRYDVVVTNPPYHNKYNTELREFISKFYSEYKYDLYSTFTFRSVEMTKDNGYAALMTPFTWMFISSYEKLRKYLIDKHNISSLIQLEYSSFKEATVPLCTFVIQNQSTCSIGEYLNLTQFKGENVQPIKVREAVTSTVDYRYTCNCNDFYNFSGVQIAFWTSSTVKRIFKEYKKLENFAEVKSGLTTSNNDLFVRLWFEVNNQNTSLSYLTRTESLSSDKKWFPYNKGGKYRKWFGNQEFVVNWQNHGFDIHKYNDVPLDYNGAPVRNKPYYFLEGITWTDISSSHFAPRFVPNGFVFANSGSMIFCKEINLTYLMCLLISKVTSYLLKVTSQTIHFEVGHLKNLPITDSFISLDEKFKECVSISKDDWDAFETSWDFKLHPLLKYGKEVNNLSSAFNQWLIQAENNFNQIKNNEEEINRIFIELYSLQDEITPDVEEDEITIRKANQVRETKSFLSYFFGCIMGRYSLDEEGLACAGGEWDKSKYKTFKPNNFGLIQLTDEHYFENDILARLREFLLITFGAETIEENLQWLAESIELKRNETAEERLRRYFLDEFFKDHCQVYQKRPIYWLVDSGKEKGLRTLIYIHRYQPDTMATIRFEHLQEIQAKYNNEIAAVDLRVVNPNLSATEKRDLEKKKTTYQKRLDELLEFDKKLAEYANAQISIDLDDGVKLNYAKFDKVLAKIK